MLFYTPTPSRDATEARRINRRGA